MSKRFLIGLSTIVLLISIAPAVLGEGALRLLTECFLILCLAQMWNLLAGYTGLVSLGHQVFVGLGAYALFMACSLFGFSPYWMLPAAPILCAVVAAAIALPLFRLRDAYFSIAMWVFAEIVATLVSKSRALGGTAGLPLATSKLINFDWFEPVLFWISGALAIGSVAGLYLLMSSTFGLGLMSVRDNDLAAMSVGVDVKRNRFIVFVLSAAGCGLAGAVSFMSNLFVTPSTAFDINWSVYTMFIAIIGGLGTLEGPIIGTAIFFGLREIITGPLGISAGWYLVALGVAAVMVMLWSPRGIWPAVRSRMGLRLLDVRRVAPAPKIFEEKVS